MNILAVGAKDRVGAELPRDLQAARVSARRSPPGVQRPRAWPSGHTEVRLSPADHGHGVAGPHAGMDADGVIRDAAGFRERGLAQGEGSRNGVQAALGHLHESCHRAVDAVAESKPVRIQVVEALPGKGEVVSITAAVSLTTRSPSANFRTFRPRFVTTPENSWPRTTG